MTTGVVRPIPVELPVGKDAIEKIARGNDGDVLQVTERLQLAVTGDKERGVAFPR